MTPMVKEIVAVFIPIALIGLFVWGIGAAKIVDPVFVTIARVVGVILLVLWLLQVFGLLGDGAGSFHHW